MKIQYDNKIVAFVDVLGFSNLVYSKTTDLISQYFTFVLEDFKNAVEKHGFKFLIISDSIVLTANDNKENLRIMVKVLYRLQQKLLEENGIILRGGISFGELFLSNEQNIIVGSGLINAYKLELKARYPRIILDREFVEKYYTGTSNLIEDLVWVKFTPPTPYMPDFIYVNYCAGFGFTDQRRKYTKVLDTLRESYYDNEHIEKYQWLKIHLEVTVEETFKYLNEKSDKSKHEKKRLKLIAEFREGIERL